MDRRDPTSTALDNKVKVTRYWPGKAPEWAVEEDEEEEEDDEEQQEEQTAIPRAATKATVIASSNDPRLRRLAESKKDRASAVEEHRQIRRAEVVAADEDESEEEEEEGEISVEARRLAMLRRMEDESEDESEEEDEDALEQRRALARQRAKEREKEEELPQEDEEEEDEEEEDSSEYETDSEEEDNAKNRLKPIFVTKKNRDTIAEREKIEDELEQEKVRQQERLKERAVESRALVEAEIQRENVEHVDGGGHAGASDIDTDDEVNEAEEYDLWKQRELKRIKRDRDLKEAAFKEREEVERLRNMTEDERREWDRRNPKPVEEQPMDKKKWNFLQKYYHKGAFYQTSSDDKFGTTKKDEIYKQDFGEAVGEDKMDKSILPKVMQVRRGQFGRSGRSKWTHLVNEDTTNWDNPWTFNDPLRSKYNNKMAGMNQALQKPSVKDVLKKGTTM